MLVIILNLLLVNFLYFLFDNIRFFNKKKLDRNNINLYFIKNRYYIIELILTILISIVTLLFNNNFALIKLNALSFLIIVYLFFKQIIFWRISNCLKIYKISLIVANLIMNCLIFIFVTFKNDFSIANTNMVLSVMNLFSKICYLQLSIFYLSILFYHIVPVNMLGRNNSILNKIFYDYVNKDFLGTNISIPMSFIVVIAGFIITFYK